MIEVILTEDIRKLGNVGQLVKVKPGYARNYLIPYGKAMRASQINVTLFEQKKADLEVKSREAREEKIETARKLDGKIFSIMRNAADNGRLYGSVTLTLVRETINAEGFTTTNEDINIPVAIKSLGVYEANVSFHENANATVLINVARSATEAEEQIFLFNNPDAAAKKSEKDFAPKGSKFGNRNGMDEDADFSEADE